MKLKLVRPKMAADFRTGPNRCHPDTGYLCPQHDGLRKWMADNVRLGLAERNKWYETNSIPCGPMKYVR